jgi:hypothetical protein
MMEYHARRGARVAVAVEVHAMPFPLPVLFRGELFGPHESERFGKKLLQGAPGGLVAVGSRRDHSFTIALLLAKGCRETSLRGTQRERVPGALRWRAAGR